jgi:exodeoxyribonuclease VII large subunit
VPTSWEGEGVADERALSVTEAMSAAKSALEGVRVRVVGEVSEFNDKPGYKAAYFTVSDGGASMPCLMWRDQYLASGVTLRCGTLVEMSGSFSAYIAKGRMQFTVRSLSLAGEGNLRLQVAALASKLEAEGLMRPERKRVVPRYPERIAVVTSPRGKAIHDVIRTLRRRYPLAELLVAGVSVEGDGAPAAIAEGLRVAGECCPDVVLLVRGGGSYEDLMPFNAEEVARAVVASPVPIVTGIGHEPDTSIADMVADLRTSTPTAAAEAVAPSMSELEGALVRERRALGRALEARVRTAAHRVARLAERPVLRDPHAVLGAALQAIDDAQRRLTRAIPERLGRDNQRVAAHRDRLRRAGARLLERPRAEQGRRAAALDALSPLAILARGYSATFSDDGHTVIKQISQVKADGHVQVRVSDGRIHATVTTTTPKEE